VSISGYVRVSVCMYVCVYVCVCACVRVCLRVFIHQVYLCTCIDKQHCERPSSQRISDTMHYFIRPSLCPPFPTHLPSLTPSQYCYYNSSYCSHYYSSKHNTTYIRQKTSDFQRTLQIARHPQGMDMCDMTHSHVHHDAWICVP